MRNNGAKINKLAQLSPEAGRTVKQHLQHMRLFIE
jgi:hypothetical protein